jgi:HEAT repeats
MAKQAKVPISENSVCTHCQSAISPQAKFCTNCGKKTDAQAAPITFPKITETPTERKAKEGALDKLHLFTNTSFNPTRETIDKVFLDIEKTDLPEAALSEILQELLEHPFAYLREKTAYALVETKTGQTKLLELLSGKTFWLKQTAVRALARAKVSQALPVLEHLLENTEDLWLKQEILLAFGEIGDIQAFNTLFRSLATPFKELKIAAVLSLKKLGDPAALPYLLPLLDDQEPTVVNTATAAINSFAKKPTTELLKTLADHKSSLRLRTQILQLLSDSPDPMATPLLINLFAQEPHLIDALLEVVEKWQEPDFIPALKQLADSSNYQQRNKALEILNSLDKKQEPPTSLSAAG